jgi:putative tryptophan/tyrosine transport system substrate-binding protein
MKRREFIALLGAATVAWPLPARAQQGARVRRVGQLMGGAGNDHVNTTAFREGLASFGWIEGRNLRIDLRYGDGDPVRIRAHAAELVSLAPEVILASSPAACRAVQQHTQTIPIVVAVDSPGASGVQNIARPEGNTTGFPSLYYSIGGKWLELLKEVAPRLARVALVFNPDTSLSAALAPGTGYFAAIEAAAPVLGVQTISMPFHSPTDLDREVEAFAAEPNSAIIVIPGAGTNTPDIRQSILLLAARLGLPTIHWDKTYPAEGGLMSYGTDQIDLHRRAASYVDRLLRGAKVSELPVQYPTKFDLVVNLRAARAIGLTIPEAFLPRADELIE